MSTTDSADLTGADLTDADSALEGCSLLGSTVSDCRLRPWTLREVDLSLTALGHADLREVVLAGWWRGSPWRSRW